MSTAATQMNSQIWCAIVGSPIKIPAVNSYVYYFSQGHLENASITNYNGIHPSPLTLCRLLSLDFFSCPYSDEPFIKFHLQPISLSELQSRPKTVKNKVEYEIKQTGILTSFTKVLTQFDTGKDGSFLVPKRCAKEIFPPLNYSDKPPQDDLSVKDTHNYVWNFHHIYRGSPLRHLLQNEWSTFVTVKRVAVGDSVVLIKRTRKEGTRLINELFIGIKRKAGSATFNVDDVKRRALAAIENAARQMVFEVDYYPMGGSLPVFVVSADRVEASRTIHWAEGMRVNSTSMTSCEGRIVAVNSQTSHHWLQSLWRQLQVSWRGPKMSPNMIHVSPWEVECLAPSLSSPALLSAFRTYKKSKFNDRAGPSNSCFIESHPSSMASLPSLHCAPFSANDDGFFPSCTKLLTSGMDDATHVVSTTLNIGCSNSDRSSNKGLSRNNIALTRDSAETSIRLFGKDIQEGEINVSEDVLPNSSRSNMTWLRNNRKGKNVLYDR